MIFLTIIIIALLNEKSNPVFEYCQLKAGKLLGVPVSFCQCLYSSFKKQYKTCLFYICCCDLWGTRKSVHNPVRGTTTCSKIYIFLLKNFVFINLISLYLSPYVLYTYVYSFSKFWAEIASFLIPATLLAFSTPMFPFL